MTRLSYNQYSAKFDDLLAKNPPVIVWRLCPVRRVQIAWSVSDLQVDEKPIRDSMETVESVGSDI